MKMYKTVRKGDASLQYTILPQTDQSGSLPSAPALSPDKPRSFTLGKFLLLGSLVVMLLVYIVIRNEHGFLSKYLLRLKECKNETSSTEPLAHTKQQFNMTKIIMTASPGPTIEGEIVCQLYM